MASILWYTALLFSSVTPTFSKLLTTTKNATGAARPTTSSVYGNVSASTPLQEIDHHWIANVSIGGQSVLLCVDTGSSLFWVTTPQAAMNQSRLYNPSKSPTSTIYRNETFSEEFPSGSVLGVVVEDSVSLGNGSATVQDLAFGFVDQKSAGIRSQPFDGFLGLGFSSRRPNKTILESYPKFFESLMPSLSAPIFSMDLRPATNGSISTPSMTFGRIHSSKFRGNITRVSIDRSTNRWIANDITFGVRGRLLNESADLVFDTGGDNYINAPFSVIEEYYSRLETVFWGSQLGGFNCTIVIPCSSMLPDLKMRIGNSIATIRSAFMKGRPLTGPANPAWGRGTKLDFSYWYGAHFMAGLSNLCIPGSQPFGSHPGKSCRSLGLIGAPFFYENYAVFNQAEPSLSYAPYV